MQIIHIIGNGFDLNLGLKTKYSDFFKYYTKENVGDSKVVAELKNRIKGDHKTWCELELALGRYTSNLKLEAQAEELILNLLDGLCDYLEKEQSLAKISKYDSEKFLSDLITPERYLTQREFDNVNTWLLKWKNNAQTHIQLLTFNYTETVEKIVSDEVFNLEIGEKFGRPAILEGVEHIHGYLNDRTVFGVNDTEQIKNENFRQSQDFVELLVKPIHNKELGHTRDDFCIQKIYQANLITIFGSSIGETDKNWWNVIGRRIGEDCRLIIYHRGLTISPRNQILESREKRKIKKKFLTMTTLNEKERKNAEKYIDVAINTNMFDLEKVGN